MPLSHRIFLYPALLCVALSSACARDAEHATAAAANAASPALDSERARMSYMVGLDMARTMTPVKEEVDIDIAIAAISGVLPPPVDSWTQTTLWPSSHHRRTSAVMSD